MQHLLDRSTFPKLTCQRGYWQIKLTESSKPKTAFRTSKGLFQFTGRPFGLVTSPATFSRLMRKVLFEIKNVDYFIDEIIIFTQTFQQHIERLEELFQRLRSAGLTAKPGKCSLAYSS